MKQNKDNQNKKQRSGFAVMCGLIGMIKPLLLPAGKVCRALLKLHGKSALLPDRL